MSDAQGNMILLITIQKGAHQSCLCANTWNAYVHLMSTTPTKQFGSNLIVVMLWTTFVSGNEVKEYNPEAIHIALAGGTSISANCLRIHISCRSTPVTRLSSYGFDSPQLQNKPKKTTGTTRLIFFWKGCRQFTQHLGWVGDWEEPSKKTFLKQQHLFWSSSHLLQTNVGGTLHTTCSIPKQKQFAPNNPNNQPTTFLPARPPFGTESVTSTQNRTFLDQFGKTEVA